MASKGSIFPRLTHVSCFARSSADMPHLLRGSHGPRSACDSSAYRMSRVSSPKDASTAGTLEAFSAA